MKRSYLVCYDVRDAKRLRRVFKTLKGYGEHWQYSVFFCVLKEVDRVRLQRALEETMNQKEDEAIIIDLGEDEETARRAVVTLGPPLPQMVETMLVI
jgi:CRISPR-associated protein Cas2